jgi:uncharacterized membrane protein (DUF373 family)
MPSREPRTAADGVQSLKMQRPMWVMRGVTGLQDVLYLVVAILLATAAVLVIVGTVKGLVDTVGRGQELQVGLLLLDRILLLLIIAELAHTLALGLYQGRIFAEPFLLIGLIAVVRRVVVVTAAVEHIPSGRALTNLLLELGVLAALALAFGAAIYLLRQSAAHELSVRLQARREEQPVQGDD